VRPIACLITDRHRLREPSVGALLEQVRAAAAAGVQLVQLREQDLEGRALFELTRLAVQAVGGTTTRVLVNDRLDVALAAGAHGVHLRGASSPPQRVRTAVPPGFLIGRSVHSAAEAAEPSNAAADYLVFGHVFATSSKPGTPGVGLDALAAVVEATARPVLALGGVSRERIPQILEAGAAGFAGISVFADCSIH
jgi:thiamine-phosphate pyrophosphorylase